MAKYGKLDLGTIEMLVNMVGGMKGVTALQRGDLMVVPKKRVHKKGRDIEFLTVTTDGTKSSQWMSRLRSRRTVVWSDAEQVFRGNAEAFPSTTGRTSRLVILKNDPLFKLLGRKHSVAYRIAMQCGWIPPDPEVACYLCEQLSQDKLEKLGVPRGLHVMHRAVRDFHGKLVNFSFGRELEIAGPNLLFSASRISDDDKEDEPNYGYVFALPDPMPQS